MPPNICSTWSSIVSTEPQSRLQAKGGAYAGHYRSGGLAKRFGAPAEAYEQFPFRVLVVCRTEERRNNIAASMLTRRPPILTMTWLTTFEAPSAAMRWEPIWIRPLDYRDVTVGTAFDPYARAARRRATLDPDTVREWLLEHASNDSWRKIRQRMDSTF